MIQTILSLELTIANTAPSAAACMKLYTTQLDLNRMVDFLLYWLTLGTS